MHTAGRGPVGTARAQSRFQLPIANGTARIELRLIVPAMGLYTILKKRRLKDRQLRILFLGLDAAGKSSIVARLLSPHEPEALKEISPTLGFKISSIDFEGYKLNICASSTYHS